MAITIVDEALLREPNLWVPGKKPIGKVKVDMSHPLAPMAGWVLQEHNISGNLPIDLISDYTYTLTTGSTPDIARHGEHVGIGGFFGDTIGITSKLNVASGVGFTIASGVYVKQSAGIDHGIGGKGTAPGSWLDIVSNTYAVAMYAGTSVTGTYYTPPHLFQCVLLFDDANNTGTAFVNGKKEINNENIGTGTSTANLDCYSSKPWPDYRDIISLYWFAWPYLLNEGAAQSLSADPYQFLIPA